MTDPTLADFKSFFDRDFPFGTDKTRVMDQDVSRALSEAKLQVNEALFGSQEAYTNAYLYLAAHNLVVNLRNSSSGLAGGFPFLATSRSVGSVSVGYQLPESVIGGPLVFFLTQSSYGVRYLNLVQALLVGNVGVVEGGTTP